MTVYFDYNATCPVWPQSIAAMNAVFAAGPANASSVHALGRAARKTIETAREQVARAIGVAPKQIIFNSGATEGNNTVLRFYRGSRLLISATEHSSVYQTGLELNAAVIPVGSDGVVDVMALDRMCAEGPAPALVSVMLANNETGVINPVSDVARIAHRYGAALHVDAVQAFGKIPVDVAAMGADFMTISSHKIGGPQGAGALVMGDGAAGACLPPPVLLTGGGQERRLRAGTENVAAIAGFGVAAEMIGPQDPSRESPCPDNPIPPHRNRTETHRNHIETHRDRIERMLQEARPDTVIFGQGAARLPNTTCFAVPGTEAQVLLMQLDLAGIAVSSGSACSSGKVGASHVLTAMGVDVDLARGALRISLGPQTTPQEVDMFIPIWKKLVV